MSQDSNKISLDLPIRSILFVTVSLLICSFLIWLSIKPFLAERHFREGHYLDLKGIHNYAQKELEKAVELAPWETYYALHLGKVMEKKAHKKSNTIEQIQAFQAIVPTYKKIITTDPNNPWYKNRLAYIYIKLASLIPSSSDMYLDLAEKLSSQAAQKDNQNPLFLLGYAQLLHKRNKLVMAAPIYEKILEIDPSILEAPYNLGDIALKDNLYDKALAYYQQVYEQRPNFASTRLAMAEVYTKRREYKEVIQILEEEIKAKKTKHLNAFNRLGEAYIKTNQVQKAYTMYENLISVNPHNLPIIELYSDILIETDNRKKAISIVRKYLANHPENTQAQELLKKIK